MAVVVHFREDSGCIDGGGGELAFLLGFVGALGDDVGFSCVLGEDGVSLYDLRWEECEEGGTRGGRGWEGRETIRALEASFSFAHIFINLTTKIPLRKLTRGLYVT